MSRINDETFSEIANFVNENSIDIYKQFSKLNARVAILEHSMDYVCNLIFVIGQSLAVVAIVAFFVFLCYLGYKIFKCIQRKRKQHTRLIEENPSQSTV